MTITSPTHTETHNNNNPINNDNKFVVDAVVVVVIIVVDLVLRSFPAGVYVLVIVVVLLLRLLRKVFLPTEPAFRATRCVLKLES